MQWDFVYEPGNAMAQNSSIGVADIVPMQLAHGDEAAYDGKSTTCCNKGLHANVQNETLMGDSHSLCRSFVHALQCQTLVLAMSFFSVRCAIVFRGG